MGFLNKKNDSEMTIECLAIGEDKVLMHRKMESTGEYLLDPKNLLAYDSFPECIGNCTRIAKGNKKFLGLTSVLYENMARPFSFKTLNWIVVMHNDEQIKDGSLARGQSKAVQRIDLNARFDRMWTLALLAVGGLVGLALLLALQMGLFSKILGR